MTKEGILKEVKYGAGNNTISIHRINDEKLKKMMKGRDLVEE